MDHAHSLIYVARRRNAQEVSRTRSNLSNNCDSSTSRDGDVGGNSTAIVGQTTFVEDSMNQTDSSFRTVFSRTGSAMVQIPSPVAASTPVQNDDAAQIPDSPAFSAVGSAAVAPSIIGSASSFHTTTSHRRRLMSQQLDELERA